MVQAAASLTGAVVTELDVDDDRELRAEYGDMVPVVLVDGVQHGYFRIDGARLERASACLARPRGLAWAEWVAHSRDVGCAVVTELVPGVSSG